MRIDVRLKGLAKRLLKRLPKGSYLLRRLQEIRTYTATEHVHELPQIAHYWSEKYVIPLLEPYGFRNGIECFRSYISRACKDKAGSAVFILSIGAGDCATEIAMAEWLRENGIVNYRFECLDLNSEVLQRGRASAEAKGLSDHFTFSTFDLNSWKPSRSYDFVLAIQSLHHFVELELLFDKIYKALNADGYFMSDDMIGRNGHQRWPEALKFVNAFWQEMPDRYKYNHCLKRFEKTYEDWDCSTESFEGIRAQDILPLLIKRFNFEFFIAFGNVVNIFVDRCFGPNFDPEKEEDRLFIDRIQALDLAEIESGRVKPTHMIAVMTKMPVMQTKMHKHLSPEFCVRRP
jgi:SAM-dependent methyltransferase